MEEGGASDGADFAVAEEATEGDGGEDFVEEVGVVVGLAVEVLAAAEAGEHEGALGQGTGVVGGVTAKDGGQVFTGGEGVAEVELDHLALAEHLANGEGPGLGVGADEVADEEVALLGIVLELVHDHAEEEGIAHEALVAFVQAGVELLEDFHGRACRPSR